MQKVLSAWRNSHIICSHLHSPGQTPIVQPFCSTRTVAPHRVHNQSAWNLFVLSGSVSSPLLHPWDRLLVYTGLMHSAFVLLFSCHESNMWRLAGYCIQDYSHSCWFVGRRVMMQLTMEKKSVTRGERYWHNLWQGDSNLFLQQSKSCIKDISDTNMEVSK